MTLAVMNIRPCDSDASTFTYSVTGAKNFG